MGVKFSISNLERCKTVARRVGLLVSCGYFGAILSEMTDNDFKVIDLTYIMPENFLNAAIIIIVVFPIVAYIEGGIEF